MKPAMTKSVSIVITCFNKEDYVQNCLVSALNQDFPNLEIILVNDGSTDRSMEKIEDFSDSLTIIHQNNKGACIARNIGAEQSSGKFVMFLDADDKISENLISNLVSAFGGSFDGIAFAPWRFLEQIHNGAWVEREEMKLRPPDDNYLANWIGGWFVPPCSVLWSRRSFERTGGWNEELWANQDGDIVMRALLNEEPVWIAPSGESFYRKPLQRTSVSNNRSEKALLSRLKVLRSIHDKLGDRQYEPTFRRNLTNAYYDLARCGFHDSHEILAKEALDLCIELGGNHYLNGSMVHKITCCFIGLPLKEKIRRILSV